MAYARLATRNTSGLHPNLRGLGFLGDSLPLSPTTAMQEAISAYSGKNLNPRDFQNEAFLSSAESQIAAGAVNLTAYSSSCGGQAAPNLNLFQTASGLALGTTSATVGFLASPSMSVIPASAVPIVGWIVAGVGAIVGLIGAIFAHHAAAVRRDLAFGCGVIPAVNNAFSVIAQAVQSGQMKPGDASTALWEIYSKYMSLGGASGSASGPGGIPGGGTAINDSPYCNSNCEIGVLIYAMCLYWGAQYQAMAAQEAATAAEAAAQANEQAPTPAPTSAPTSAQSLTSPAVPTSEFSPTVPAGSGGFSLKEIPAWGWLALAAIGAWAVM